MRQWQLVHALAGQRYGLTVRQLVSRLDVSKQTVYRDLETLRDAGVPLATHTSNGEARYRLLAGSELPPLGLSPLQVAALHLARAQLEPIAGSDLIDELDRFLTKLQPSEPQQIFQFATKYTRRPEILKLLDRAIRTKRRARIEYRAVSRNGAATTVHVEPFLLRVSGGEPYFRAYCVERGAERTYKIARVRAVELTGDPATHVSGKQSGDRFAGAVKAWSGDLTTVKIALDREVAWLAREYPLVGDQELEQRGDGTALVQARVAGTVEAARWVLSWGGAAEALEPPELRQAVRAELAKGLAKYGGPGPAKAARQKSPRRHSDRRTQAGTGRA